MTLVVEKSVVEELLEGAKKVGELAEEEMMQAEENCSVSDKVVNLMKETKITRIMLPKKYGEPQVDLRTLAKIVQTVSYHNVSAGWLTYLYPLHNILPSYLPEEGMDEIVNQGGCIADVFATVGKAERDGDGFRITGTWDYCSGVLHSDWIGLGVFAQFPDSDKPEVCLPMLKASEVEIVKNWDTFGLRGTGSNRVIADNVYVPMERVVRLEKADSLFVPPQENYDKDYPFYHKPFYPAFYFGFAYMALGGTERLIEEFKIATQKRTRLMDNNINESHSPRSQRVLAEITTEFKAAQGLMDKYMDLLENYGVNNCVTPRAEFFALRTKTTKICAEIAVRVLMTLGGAALYKGSIIEVLIRDILSVATHKTSLYEDAVAAYGKELFGFDGGVRG